MLNDSNIILEEVTGRCGSIGGPPCTAYLLIIMDPLNRSVIIYEYDMGCPVPLRLNCPLSSLYFAFMFFSGSEVRPFVNPGEDASHACSAASQNRLSSLHLTLSTVFADKNCSLRRKVNNCKSSGCMAIMIIDKARHQRSGQVIHLAFIPSV